MLKLYWIDLCEAVKQYVQDLSDANKLYHAFEMANDSGGHRIFDKANSAEFFKVSAEISKIITSTIDCCQQRIP